MEFFPYIECHSVYLCMSACTKYFAPAIVIACGPLVFVKATEVITNRNS